MSSRPQDTQPESFTPSPDDGFDPGRTTAPTVPADPIPPPTPPLLPSVPGYEVLEELGRGGMGVVYKARQIGFNRVVALKMLLSGAHAGPEERERFRIEAQAVARLQHANIVQVHDVGEHDGLPFFSMEFCRGGSLERKLNATPLPSAEAAALMEKLARAVQAAHDKGVIHRDLKPANVLMAEDGTPKVVDFGLAKQMDTEGRTHTGAVMGTPSYMAPEQAAGKAKTVGPATDIYALGAILYECLTGRPPFRAATALSTIGQVLGEDPVPPRYLQPRTPRDLETICLKCLEKQPGRRYGTAVELAEDLARWQHGDPVKARPASLGYVLWKQCRRYRAPLTVAAAMLLLLAVVVLTAFGLLVAAWNRAENNFEALQKAMKERELTQEDIQRQFSNLARSYADRSGAEFRTGDVRDSLNWMLRAYELAPAGDPQRPTYLRLIPDRGRSIARFTVLHDGAVNGAAFSPDGKTLATASWDRTVRVWDVADGKERLRLSHDAEAWRVSFGPDGRTIAAASDDRTARLWDAADGKERRRFTHDGPVYMASFSPDGKTLVTASADHTARVWNIADGGRGEVTSPLLMLQHPDAVWGASFSPDGRTIATACRDGIARLWNAADGKPLREFRHDGPINVAWFSPDGRTLLTASGDRTARIWDVASGQELQRFHHDAEVLDASFSPDGRTVVTASYDHTARLWDVATGQELQRLPHGAEVLGAAFSADGRFVVTACRDKAARLWEVDFPPPPTDVDPDRLRAWVLVHTRQDFTEEGALRPLTSAELETQQRKLDEKGGDWQTPPDPRQWHLAQASDAEANQAWFAARFHLDWLLKGDPNNADLLRRRDAADARLRSP
ncbi:MAG TPA: serine/threonine-protein kinase [Gemmataceae bacterium]|nr:serine/threonine-protein kinase [Gemmataceae bacterium]